MTAIVELLTEMGVRLPFPYSSGVMGSKYPQMRELRIQSHGEPIRIFYAFDQQRVAVLLIGGLKTGKSQKRFYREYIKKADALFAEHLSGIDTNKDDEV